ncbi:MAG: hypothetical protein ACOH1U_07810 [Rhodoglobus sp.]
MTTQSRHHSWPICVATGKQRLRERQEVGLALRAAKLRRDTATAEGRDHSWQAVRGYKCEHCNGYHLTSRPTWVDRSTSAESA